MHNDVLMANVRAMITFHGVFDGVAPPPRDQNTSPNNNNDNNTGTAEVLFCHGALDPFVNAQTILQPAVETLERQGHQVRVLTLPGAKHGFSNPAQDFNPNPAFGYHEAAAQQSWTECLAVLQRTLGPNV